MTNSDLSDKEFALFSQLVYDKAGINLHDGKKELVRSRLSRRLRAKNIQRFKDYYKYLMADESGEELVNMLDAISTNLTSFFREPKHFTFLEDTALPSILKRINPRTERLSIWSAGCSSGEEPYTLAICLHEFMKEETSFDFKILATDISTKVLSSAANGVYMGQQIRNIPAPVLRKYFQRGQGKWADHYRLKPYIRNEIEFKRLNLMEPFPFTKKFHIIFCRNVMIYFDKMVQNTLVNKYYDALIDGGYLFIGHSESLMGTQHQFQYVKPTIYQK
jgi:chemotaxis protein methyltransferase CheR